VPDDRPTIWGSLAFVVQAVFDLRRLHGCRGQASGEVRESATGHCPPPFG
jgi:hypothetical protein